MGEAQEEYRCLTSTDQHRAVEGNMEIKFASSLTLALVAGAIVVILFVQATPAHRTEPSYVENWRDDLGKGESIGSSNAKVQLMEFESMECPSCAGLDERLKALQSCYRDLVAVTFVPHPLLTHQCPDPSTQIAECTDQDDLPDTPTLLINGWKLKSLPTPAEFDDMVVAILDGSNPLSDVAAPAAPFARVLDNQPCLSDAHRSATLAQIH
jgi:hypothetical protein